MKVEHSGRTKHSSPQIEEQIKSSPSLADRRYRDGGDTSPRNRGEVSLFHTETALRNGKVFRLAPVLGRGRLAQRDG